MIMYIYSYSKIKYTNISSVRPEDSIVMIQFRKSGTDW